MVNSITPKPAPKWPPVLDTDEISYDLSSSDKSDNCSKDRIFKSLGDEIFSKIDFWDILSNTNIKCDIYS